VLARYVQKVHGVEAVLGFREERDVYMISKNNGTESVHIASGEFMMLFFDHFLLMGVANAF